jgi:hypothetical protein
MNNLIAESLKSFRGKFNCHGAFNYKGLVIKYLRLDEYQIEAVEAFWQEKMEEMYQAGIRLRNTPGVTEWKQIGEKYGYWEYFKKEAIAQYKETGLK